ncbi:MAG: hypothetical protein ACXADL_00655 [Candidatus Thorarchaeota archaeon]|jgi:predicted transcriptional regulator
MDSQRFRSNKPIDADSVRNLVGELGIEILGLIRQEFTTDEELIQYGSVTLQCLEVKIPLLETLDLITQKKDGYKLTKRGKDILIELLGW